MLALRRLLFALLLIAGASTVALAISLGLDIPSVSERPPLGGGGLVGGPEEFVGPFANWINAKTGKRFDGTGSSVCTGAVGDGVANDTTALQSCLNALSSSAPSLWVPAGTYKINSTLTLSYQQYLNIIGADPATTSIVWAGGGGFATCTTSNANDFLVGAYRSGSNTLTGGGSGWTQIDGSDYLMSEYQIVSATQSGINVPFANVTTVAGVCDAVQRQGAGPLALDGHAARTLTGSGTSVTTAALTTANANDVIVLVISENSPTSALAISSPNTTGWTLRATSLYGSIYPILLYYGTASAPLTAETITITSAGGWGNIQTNVFGISGANVSTIADPNSLLPGRYQLGGAMVNLNGIAYSRIDRLTFDGAGVAPIGISQSWDNTGAIFDSGNEYADDVIKNTTSEAFSCGNLGFGCAETAMLRDTYSGNNKGISMRNFNALDMWSWYNTFTNNADAVTNTLGAGNVSVFNSIFSNSTDADFYVANTGVMTLENNFSSGSNQFLICGGVGSPNSLSVEGNTVINPTLSGIVGCFDYGAVVLMDNIFQSPVGGTTPAVNTNGDIFSVGNTYTVGTATCGSAVGASTRCHSAGDQVVSRGSISTTPPVLPGTPHNLGRTIYEATPGGSGTICSAASPCSITQAITNAAAGCFGGVAHLQAGTYNVSATITAPANCLMQIIGDGNNTNINWTGAASGTVLQFTGPSKVIARDFFINATTATGILITNSDQVGGRIFGEQVILYGTGVSTAEMLVNGLNSTTVEMHDFGLAGPSGGDGLFVQGGGSSGGSTNIFASAGGSDATLLHLNGGGHLAVRQMWGDAPTGVRVSATGSGAMSLFGMNATGSASALVGLSNFSGTSAIINNSMTGVETISGTGGNAKNLVLGQVSSGPGPVFSDTTSPSDTFGYLSGQIRYNQVVNTSAGTASGSAVLTFASLPAGLAMGQYVVDNTLGAAIPPNTTILSINSGAHQVTMSANATGTGACGTSAVCTADAINFTSAPPGIGSIEDAESSSYGSLPSFLTTTLAPLRAAQPTVPAALPVGVTDVRLYRIFVGNSFNYGIVAQ